MCMWPGKDYYNPYIKDFQDHDQPHAGELSMLSRIALTAACIAEVMAKGEPNCIAKQHCIILTLPLLASCCLDHT